MKTMEYKCHDNGKKRLSHEMKRFNVAQLIRPLSGGVRTTIAMHCGFKIFKMAAKVEKFRRLYALFFNRYSSFLRSFFSIS